MGHIQIKLSDEAMQAVRAAGSDGGRVLERFIRDYVDEFERNAVLRWESPLNDKLDKSERAICQSMLQHGLGSLLEQPHQ